MPLFRTGLYRTLAVVGIALAATTTARGEGVSAAKEDLDAADLTEVFRCRFDEEWDVNYDGWPDRWERVNDDERPRYVRMELADAGGGANAPSGRALVIRPDGAAASVFSPPIRVMPKFSYLLSARVRVRGAEHGSAHVRLEFRDARGTPRQVERFGPFPTTGEWIDLQLPPYQPVDERIDHLVLRFDYRRGGRGDLKAELALADVRLGRAPSIRIQTDSVFNVYTDPKDVRVTCTLSGILERNPEIRFQLLDATNKRIGDQGVLELDGQVISESTTKASEIVDGFGDAKRTSYEGSIDWRPPITDYGFYRVRVQMISQETGRVMDDPAITLAVVRSDLDRADGGEFGWTLPRADNPLPFSRLQDLLPLAGVNRVKLPVWYPVEDDRRGDDLGRFAEQLAARGIETIAVLEDPSERLVNPLTVNPAPPIEGLLAADPSHWMPLVDHVITKLSLRIGYWQLGADGDTSFVGDEKVVDKIAALRGQMFRFGQDVRLGIGWRWDHVREWGAPIAWDFEQMSVAGASDASLLAAALAGATRSTAERWVVVAPPGTVDTEEEGAGSDGDEALDPHETADAPPPVEPTGSDADRREHEDRVRDFVEQLIAAKVHGADGIFISDPFSGQPDAREGRFGVMNVDGTPGELLLPWRTCARLLGGAEHLGSIILPRGSQNWLFKRRDGRVVMVLWNHLDTTESLYLGENVGVVDIWGKAQRPREVDGRQEVRVDRVPRFVIGLNEHVARWRMSAGFAEESLPSVFGVPHANAVHVTNEFPQGIGGSVEIVASGDPSAVESTAETWRLRPAEMRFSLAKGESKRLPFETTLVEAGYGAQPIRLDFKVQADRDYEFSVWRSLHVGQGDLRLEVRTHLGEDGRLRVYQTMRNPNGKPSDFRCLLYAPPERRKRAQVFQLGETPDKKVYTYLNGESLVGREMKLRIEEIDGQRVLIHRFVVEPGGSIELTPEEGLDGADPLSFGG